MEEASARFGTRTSPMEIKYLRLLLSMDTTDSPQGGYLFFRGGVGHFDPDSSA